MSGDRPDAMNYYASDEFAADMKQPSVRRMPAKCQKCGHRIGVVVGTRHGPMWVGLLGNRDRSRGRARVFGPVFAQNSVAQWVHEGGPYYWGECACPRNAADGATVWAAWLVRRCTSVKVPPQD